MGRKIDREIFPENPQVEFRFDLPREKDRLVASMLRPFPAVLLDGRTLVTPIHYLIDGASKPWFTYSFGGGPYDKPYFAATIPHDFLCDLNRDDWYLRLKHLATDHVMGEHIAEMRAEFKMSPKEVHDNFNFHCRAAGTHAFRRQYMTLAVRAGCRNNWRSDV